MKTIVKMNIGIRKWKVSRYGIYISLLFALCFGPAGKLDACSTFKLQKGDTLIYGHNLNEGDIGVPGMVFINKRGVFKTGRSWSEIITRDRIDPSSHVWISRYGSVTFNNFGRDFPDGGMNEEGLFIWEMNEDADYPKGKGLPRLSQMNWMQYILDNYSTTEEAVSCASEIEIDGWGWHFFVGDAQGNTAAIAFVNGEPLVYTGKDMPVSGLFNTPYAREMELLKYFKGFGGTYEPVLDDPTVPRFVKTAVMTRDYDETKPAVDYGFKMLEWLKVNDVPEWSIIFDARKKDIYFKTRINPEIKTLSMDQADFSNNTPTLVVNMDIQKGGNVYGLLQPFTTMIMRDFTREFMVPILPENFFTRGGLTLGEYVDRIATHTDAALSDERQFFKGTWSNRAEAKEDEMQLTIIFVSDLDAVKGKLLLGKESYPADHLQLTGDRLSFTIRTKKNTLLEIRAVFKEGKMIAGVYGIEDYYGSFLLSKEL
jgi:choloylglycine hydrolase